jgi:SAM-dependent methyltransferase
VRHQPSSVPGLVFWASGTQPKAPGFPGQDAPGGSACGGEMWYPASGFGRSEKDRLFMAADWGFWCRHRGGLARLVGLDLTHSQKRYARLLESMVQPGCRWLELGCGRQIIPDWAYDLDHQLLLTRKASILVGVDVDEALLEHPLIRHKVMALGGQLPFRGGAFDLVSANMVVEHISRPEEFLADIRRVLAPGGKFVFHTPNVNYPLVWVAKLIPYRIRKRLVYWIEGRAEDDVFPTYYRMNSLSAIRRQAARAGFHVLILETVNSSGTFGRWGFAGWLEVLIMRLLAAIGVRSNILCVLQKA